MANGQKVTSGPFGGPGGDPWDDGTYSTIRKIIINTSTNNVEINSIQVIYDVDGKLVTGQKRGARPGKPHTVTLNYPTEYLVSMSGYHSKQFRCVNSIIFQSNIKQYGPYGTEGGTRFESRLAAGGKIVGFLGRKGDVLDSIGVHIVPFQITIPSVGPFGTTGGQQWDDGNYDTIREIVIYSGRVIDSIKVVYDSDGKPITGKKHGGDGGQLSTVKLDFPNEFLVSVWGYYGQLGNNMVVIKSLGFRSNKTTYGPFGVEEGEKFEFPSTGGKIIGFHGRSNGYLNAIGAYLDK